MEGGSKMGGDCSDSPLSSDIISLPHGNRLENISPITECSDSEYESNVDGKAVTPNKGNEIVSDEIGSIPLNEYCGIDDLASRVKSNLQENSNMLADKTILKDLLLPQSTNFVRELFIAPQKCTITEKPYMPSSLNSNCEGLYYNNEAESIQPNQSTHSYLSQSSTPKKNQSRLNSLNKSMPMSNLSEDILNHQPKHVQFSSPLCNEQEGQSRFHNNTQFRIYGSSVVPGGDSNMTGHQSFSSYSTDLVLNRLNEIRHHLDTGVKDTGEESSPELQPLVNLLYSKLNSQKQRIKDLEEELALNEASLAKITRELEIVQNRLSRREEQLKEAIIQLDKLQSEWQVNQQKLILSRDSFRSHNEQLRKTLGSLESERENLRLEMKDLLEKCKNYSSLQIQAEDIKMQLSTTSKRYNEVNDENKRINDKLKENEEKISFYEKRTESLNDELRRTHQCLAEITAVKSKLEQDLQLLEDRHAVLLEKTLEEEQSREKAQQETVMFLGELNKLKSEATGQKDNLHQYYQGQLETLVKKTTQELQAQIETLENELKEKFSKENEFIRERHNREIEDINRRHIEEIGSIKVKYETKEGKLVLDIRNLQKQNKVLQQQRQAILNAVTSVIPQTELNSSLHIMQHEHLPSRTQPFPETNRMAQSQLVNSKSKDITTFKHREKEDPYKSSLVRVPPLITSTSYSSLSDLTDGEASSVGRVTVQERKSANQKRQKQKETHRVRAAEKRIFKAAEILNSLDTLVSDESSKGSQIPHQQFRDVVDKNLDKLIDEISDIQPPSMFIEETPCHDTSFEQDPKNLTLEKIDRISHALKSSIRRK